MAIQRIQTNHGPEFGTDFTWHLRDLGVAHRQIPWGCPQVTGKVERGHLTDEDEFYRRVIFRTPAELAEKPLGARIQSSPPPPGARGGPPAEAPLRASDGTRICPTIGLNITN
jgi:hypothetical protein